VRRIKMRPIDADALKNYFVELSKENDTGYGDTSRMVTINIKFVIEAIKNSPTIEPKQGEWEIITIEPYNFKFRCKECGWYENHAYEDVRPHNFCPNCGARMIGTADESD
jgi:Zn finger protein HypA/HybF involved in hydrogenase expression